MRLLDLFCGAGMAADGYRAAGFTEIVGVDASPQPDYPYDFHWDNAFNWLDHDTLSEFDAIHASPPCQAHTRAKHLRAAQGGTAKYEDLLTPTLAFLHQLDIPWVVENVPGAPGMDGAVVQCGSAYGLGVQRHRLFKSNRPLVGSGCNHKAFPIDPATGKPRPWGVYHVPKDDIPKGGRTARNVEHGREVMGVTREIPWASLKEGFPPAYTEHIGRQLIEQMAGTR